MECERRADKAKADIVNLLTSSIYAEELFLEMFEDEFFNFEVGSHIFLEVVGKFFWKLSAANYFLSYT